MFLCAHVASNLRQLSKSSKQHIMEFAQKIYYNNKPLIITSNSQQYIASHPVAADYLLLTGASTHNCRLATEHLDKPGTLGAMIEGASTGSLHNELYSIYEPIDAGGGVVLNEAGAVL